MCYSWAQHKQMYTLHADSRPEKCQFTLHTAPCSAGRLPTMYFSWIYKLVLDIFYQQLGGFMSIGGVIAPFGRGDGKCALSWICTYIYSRIFSFWILQKTYFSNHMLHNSVCEFGSPTFQGQQQHFPGTQFAGAQSDHQDHRGMIQVSGWTRLPSSCQRSCPSLLKWSIAFIFVFLGLLYSLSISSGPTSRVVDNVLRCMRSLPSLFESSVKARGTDVATVVVPGGQGAHLPIYKEITMY